RPQSRAQDSTRACAACRESARRARRRLSLASPVVPPVSHDRGVPVEAPPSAVWYARRSPRQGSARMLGRRGLTLGVLGIALLAGAVPWAQSQQPPQPPVREITKIAGEVYRFRNAGHYSVFAVTPAGVIATDPINADAARWLKAETAQRFKQPI